MSEKHEDNLTEPSPETQVLSEKAAERQMQECVNGDDCLECGECKAARKRALQKPKGTY